MLNDSKHCNMTLWEEMPTAYAKKFQNILKCRSSELDYDHPCKRGRLNPNSSRSAVSDGSEHATGAGNGHENWYGASSGSASSQAVGLGKNKRHTQAHKKSQVRQSKVNQQPGYQMVINAKQTKVSRVLFGVKGSRRTLELAQIDTLKHDEDEAFFAQLKRDYKEHRGFWRYWFSIWRFNHCTFVKARFLPSISPLENLTSDSS